MSEINTNTNKARRAAALLRWLKRRQSPEVRERLAHAWQDRNKQVNANQILVTVLRYGIPVEAWITPRKETARA